IDVDLAPENTSGPAEAAVRIVPVGATVSEEPEKVRPVAHELLNQLRTCMGLLPEHRAHVRLPFTRIVHVYPVNPDLQIGARIEGKGKDISLTGVGLTLPQSQLRPQFYVHFPDVPALRSYALLARLIHTRDAGKGTWEIGASFCTGTES